MSFKKYKYSKDLDTAFASTVKGRVNDFFQSNGLSKNADTTMIVKALIMCLLFFGPLALMYTGLVTNYWILYGLWIIMGVGKAGIGTGIMHDAIHGAFSKSAKTNKLLSNSMNLIGGNAYVWFIQHNVLHHTYPNIDEADDDIDIPFVLRMSPHQPRYWFHKYQHIYVWVLYSFATIFWVTTKDFVQLNKYWDRGLVKNRKEYWKHVLNIVVWKIVYYVYLLVLPLILIPIPALHVISMFIVMHLVAGILLSIIFQPAHVFEGSNFLKVEDIRIDKSWIGYQLETTTNFGLKGFLKWMAGGLNYQIEHHLFPTICHSHYPKIAHIVKNTAEEFNLPYHFQKDIWGALHMHSSILQHLGQPHSQPKVAV